VERLVFVDESGFTVSMTRAHSRSVQGTRAHGKVPRNRGAVLTVLGAMRTNGETAFATFECGTSKEVFKGFVREVLLQMVRPGDIVVWDNLAAHKSPEVKQMLRDRQVHIHWQPPYTPEANAIELLWHWLKDRIRKAEPRSRELLEAVLVQAASELPRSHAEAWTRHCGYTAA